MIQVLQHFSRCRYFLIAILLLQILPVDMLSATVKPSGVVLTQAQGLPGNMLSAMVNNNHYNEPRRSIKEAFTTLRFDNENLVIAFKEIEEATGFGFSYNINDVKGKKVSGDFINQSLFDILVSFSHQLDLTFRQYNDMINVKVKKQSHNSEEVEIAKAAHTVQGTVTDQLNGEPLPGVNVMVKGTNIGTVTDIDGNYNLDVPDENHILVFSFIGFTTQEVAINGRSSIDLALAEDVQSLEEVVVVGYGTQKRRDLTGSVASANIEAFREAPNVNILQSLQGSVPGVQIGQVNQAGEEPSISIRGRTTLSGSTQPLVVVDGIIFRGRLADINPTDVESVDILKDPSSKAIYGAQAANGVVLITTKSGRRSEEPTFNYSGSVTTQQPTRDYRLLNREEYLQVVRDVNYLDAYLPPNYTEPNPDYDFRQSELLPRNLSGIDDGTNYDWWDGLTSPGFMQNHELSVSGGSEKTNYFISGGFTDQEGFVLNDLYQRVTARINIDTEVTDWLTLGANTFGSFGDRSGSYPNMNAIANTSPLVEPWDENGELVVRHMGGNSPNPFLNAQADDRNLNNRLTGILFATLRIPQIEGLSYRLNFSNSLNWFSHAYSSIYDASETGRAFKAHSQDLNVMLDNIITYKRRFNDHGLNLTLVAGYNKATRDRTYAAGQNFANLDLSYNSLEQATIMEISSDAWEEVSLYQMGRVNYDFKNRYLLTATLRRDGFSGFAKNNKFGLFPSFGAGWVISEESFFDVPVVDFLKIRGSYGQNGNLTSRYSSLARVSSGRGNQYVFGDGASPSLGQSPASLANMDLSWEKTSGLNIGLDFEILKERVRGNIEYYSTTTTDLLWDLRLPRLTGFSRIPTNLGRIENTGFEFSIETEPVQSQNFSWNLNLNFSTNKNKIVELLGEEDLIASGLFMGESIGTIYGYEIDGIWQVNDEIPDGYSPGTYRIVDQNDDGVISAEDDRIILGRSEPAYRAGILNTLRYKNFTFRFFVNTIQGGKDGYLGANHPTGIDATSGNVSNSNWFNMYDYWSTVNTGATYPIPWASAQIRPAQYFSRSFIRLQDISLSYNLNLTVAEKIGIKSAKVFVSGKNVLTFTKWDGWDPETGQGIGIRNAFPVMRAFSLGINASF